MELGMWLVSSASVAESTLAEVNGRLTACGLSITREDARMLAECRAVALADTERVEFGTPAIVEVAESVAGSPCLTQANVAEALTVLQGAFYAIRDELPADVPDAEIAEALCGCLDAWGNAAEVASMPAKEVMRFSKEYVRIAEAKDYGAYRIVDDEGLAHTFDPAEWDYDEHADGWDGEGWADGWDG